MKRGIPTTYRGIQFRSRIEARWAVLFDQLRWPWEYEPLDLDGYIPDFVLQFHRPLLVEVKHEFAFDELLEHRTKIEQSGWKHEAIIVGATPFLQHPDGSHFGPTIGVLGERGSWEMPGEWSWDQGVLFLCDECGHYSILHELLTWQCRRAGCYDGDGHINPIDASELGRIEGAWGMACNLTAWGGRAA